MVQPFCSLRYLIGVIVAAEIVLVLVTISSMTVFSGKKLSKLWFSAQDISAPPDGEVMNEIDNYDNGTYETADAFIANYSLYCEKYLLPFALNIQRYYSRGAPLCPCIPDDLGLCFVHNT